MLAWSPTRRLLGLPAWFWVLLPIPLFWLASQLYTFWVPPKLPEPGLRAEIFRDGILVARDGDAFRFVPFGEHNAVKPLWAVNVGLLDRGQITWEKHYFFPGLFRRQSTWTYTLAAHRFDPDWKGDATNPFELPEPELRRLRPLVVAELNRRQPSTRDGDRLENLLTHGLKEESFVCPQNGVVLLAWLSVPLALVGLGVMFLKPRRPKSEQPQTSDAIS